MLEDNHAREKLSEKSLETESDSVPSQHIHESRDKWVSGRTVIVRSARTCKPMAFSSDVEIAELLCADPERGFALLLRQHGGRIRGYLQRRFPSFDAVDVHDVITDALLALESSFDASRGSLAAWFLLLAHQRAVQLLRSRKRSIATAGDGHAVEQPATGPDGLAGLITAERITELRQVVASLPALEMRGGRG